MDVERPPPPLVCRCDRLIVVKQEYPPAYSGNLKLFIHFYQNGKALCLLDIIPHIKEKCIVYIFGKIRITYKPANPQMGHLISIGPRQLARSIRRLPTPSRKSPPHKILQKMQIRQRNARLPIKENYFCSKDVIRTHQLTRRIAII